MGSLFTRPNTQAPQSLPADFSKVFENKAALAAEVVDGVSDHIWVNGSKWSRRDGNPGHTLSGQDANGAWWEHSDRFVFSSEADAQVEANLTDCAEAALKMLKPYNNLTNIGHFVDVNYFGQKFATAQDADRFEAGVAAGLATQNNWDEYQPAIETFNRMRQVWDWYLTCVNPMFGGPSDLTPAGDDNTRRGLRIRLGLSSHPEAVHPLFGRYKLQGPEAIISEQGIAVHYNNVVDVTFTPHPDRGAGYYVVRAYVSGPLPTAVKVGAGASWRNALAVDAGNGNAPDYTTSIDKCTGHHIITDIDQTANREWFEFDLYDVRGDGMTGLSGSLALASGMNANKVENNEVLFQYGQKAWRGGWDARAHEGPVALYDGAHLQTYLLSTIDHTDPAVTPPNGHAPARKLLFVGDGSTWVDEAGSGMAGAEESTVRVTGGRTFLNQLTIGSVGKLTRAQRGFRYQIGAEGHLIRCFAGGYDTFCAEVGGGSKFTAQVGHFANSLFGSRGLSNALVNLQSQKLSNCNTCIDVDDGAKAFIDTGTELSNSDHGLKYRSGAQVFGTPTFVNVDTNSDAPQGQTSNEAEWIATV